MLGLHSRRRPRDGALGGGAEDARDREPGSGRARGARGADAPPRLRLRRSDGRAGDGPAHRARRGRRPTRRCAICSSKIGQGDHTRLPVYRDDLDNVVGMLHVTDVLKALAAGDMDVNAGALAREALTVPDTLGADDLLAEMRRRRVREALVIDEYGGTAGPGHLRIADGADRRRDSRRDRRADAHRHPAATDRRTSTASRSSPTSTSSSACTSTKTPTRRWAATCSAASAAARASATRSTSKAAGCGSRRSTGCGWRRCGCRSRTRAATGTEDTDDTKADGRRAD